MLKIIRKNTIWFCLLFLVVGVSSASAAPLVIGKRYPLNTKAQRGTLVWRFVTFHRSIMGGIRVQLEVYNTQGEKVTYFDDYRDIVDKSIQAKTLSKFDLDDSTVSFSSDRYADISFQVKKLKPLYYLPVRVEYKNGFEDYLVRFRLYNGKFSVASRLLQQGRIITPEMQRQKKEALENLEAKSKTKKKGEKKEGSIEMGVETLKGEKSKVIKRVLPAKPPKYEDPSDIEFDELPDLESEEGSEKIDNKEGDIEMAPDINAPFDKESDDKNSDLQTKDALPAVKSSSDSEPMPVSEPTSNAIESLEPQSPDEDSSQNSPKDEDISERQSNNETRDIKKTNKENPSFDKNSQSLQELE